MAKPTPADIKLLTDNELEVIQLAVNAEVAIRIQNQRLKDRIITALTEAQGVGFTDAEIEKAFAEAQEHVHKGKRDPAADMPMPNPQPRKAAKGLSERTTALIKPRTTTKK